MHVGLTGGDFDRDPETGHHRAIVRSCDRSLDIDVAAHGAGPFGEQPWRGVDQLAEQRYRRTTEAVVRAGLEEGDSGAIRALQTHADARDLDEVLAWMIEFVVACLEDRAGLSAAAVCTRCEHCGAPLDDFGRADSGPGLAARAVEAALLGDHAEVRSSVTCLLDVTDTDSRNHGLVWLLRVIVRCAGEVLRRDGFLPHPTRAS